MLLPTIGTPAHAIADDTPVPIEGRSRGRALVIDDEAVLRLVLSRMLESLGYDVQVADSGVQAIETFESGERNFDVVMLDMMMPQLDGNDTYHRMRDLGVEAPVVLMSGYNPQLSARSHRRRRARLPSEARSA